ncbi:putative pectin methylesterase [Aspergillus saccharolyticus JOP 1030-1]|uniref:pectinesterase n=1 Tax=Aspergillus saccharolyticus JOP 1030-1 TaxID=1450539 RepID=A0A318ZIN8_9EURO|nr:pectin lyase-like protein [Aspergillus saccharolyticus JOP 1030-1]PYH40108.1 pectin lyase-like protein [Aspergillus saccharolyticus JOP 1030-1]
MQVWSVLGVASLALVQSCAAAAAAYSSSSVTSQAVISTATATSSASTQDGATTTSAGSTTSSSENAVTTSSSASSTAVVVATDTSGQFTAIGDAISYAQSMGLPTVTVKAGTYTQAVTVSATATVTVIGESSSQRDYSQNQVTISATSPLTISSNVLGITFRNINFVNTATGSSYAAAVIRGSKNAFYGCQFVSAGSLGINANLGLAVIADSYIEALDKIIYGYPGLYVYNTTVVPVDSSALIVYNKGATYNSVLYNSTVVFDSCTVQQKSGTSTSNVYLGAANKGYGSVVVYRGSALGSLIAASGAYTDSYSVDSQNFYGEYQDTGAGSYANNEAKRSAYVHLLSASDLTRFSPAGLFSSVYSQFATTSTDWVDAEVLAAIQSADASQQSVSTSSAQVSSSTSGTTTSTTTTQVTASAVTSTLIRASVTTTAASSAAVRVSASSSTLSSATSSSSSGCSLPSTVPTSALVVGPSGSCAQYTSIASAVAALPSDSTTQYVYILSGTYEEAITISREGATVFRGETANALDQSSNTVTIVHSAAVLSSNGGSASTATFQASQYYAKGISFYNINFENDYTPTKNYIAVAVAAKAQVLGFYGCGIKSSQGGLLINYGAFYFSDCRIEGTTDFIWGYGGIYVYNSRIISDGTTTGQTIAAQSYQSTYEPSQFVFDSCAFVPSDSSVPKSSTYLGRDYSTSARVAVLNSYLDAHIAPIGWLISSSSSSVTFAEYNNTGPGASTSSRSSVVDILSDDSAYTLSAVLGSTSWIDTSAVAPFSGFPDSVYGSSASSSVSVTATASSSVTASATSAAATSTSTFVVSQNATTGQYRNVTAAIAALPNDGMAYTIYIHAGTYTEQISITRSGKVTLRGETSFENDYTQNLVTIEFSNGELTSAGEDESTPVINAKKTDGTGLALYNINFQNTYPQTSNTAALAADFYGTNMAAYGCSFIGFQDTLLANKGTQVFSNCYIEGSIDYIWGYSTAYFHQCYIATNTPGACIAAQSRSSSTASGGYVFDTCYVTYTSSYGSTYGKSYLGRPYSEYSIAVYMNSYLDKHINAAGWEQWSTSSPNTAYVTFGEYNNSGPGAWSSSRVSFATNLTATQAALYTLSSWIGDTSWLDMTAYDYVPSYSLTGPTTTTSTNTSTSTSTATATWAHPTSGTVPPSGAVLVSPGGTVNGSYSTLTDALASLPDDSTTQIIFMYAGSYDEQVPSVNRDGPVMIIGYQSGSPGATYQNNQVTITYSRGLSVSPLPTGHSDAETATFATASNQIALYNIDIINTANLDGSESSYVTLAGSIYGSEIGFYGCSFVGWQDTLLTGSTTGYQYYESSYIEGAIDFIWGYSKAYFKGCTIGAKRQKSAITAQSRASSTAVGGYIFDQCLFEAASDATVDLTELVYLGRPYSEYALVVVKNSYLTDIINPSGWKVWSTSDPRTDYVTFAEYNNSGPGNWENNAASREAFEYCTLLTSDTYTLSEVMGSTDWIDMTYWDSIVTPEPASTTTTTTTTTGSNSTTIYDGTTPPAGAYIVSKTAIANVTTYDTIQSALNALPTSSKVTPTVFIYPGTYEEQLVVNRSGTTIFMGYSDNHLDYASNQVTIQYNHGVDTQADESNSDSATVYATGNYFQAININFVNNFGTTKDYASLGFAVKSSKYASLYGCQVTGNQDALLINGYFFASNSYVEGNIDMIWGSGSGYFLNSTISPNEDGINLTADKRSTSTSVGGFVFDQCTVTPASGAGSMSEISLGRPWNSYARVAYIESYLDSCVEAAGWEQWSSSSPQTDGVLFGEYQNYGPGSSTTDRASFATVLDASTVAQFELTNFFASTSWINLTLVDGTPFVPGNSTTVPVTSASLVSSTSELVTATPTTTVTTLLTVTDQETAFTTLTPADRTSTVKVTVTEDVGTTVTLAESFKTTVEKTTISSTVTISEPTVTSVTSTVITSSDLETITAPASTKTTTVKDTTTVTATVTEGDVTTTIKSTVTATSTITSSAKAKIITSTVASTTTSVKTSTPGTVTVSSYTTVTQGSGGTTTESTKATTTTVDVTSTKTSTKTVTTTLSCIPSANAKRDLILPRATVNAATVTQYTTLTTYVRTSTDKLASPTVFVTSTTTKTTGETSTLKASTSTITSVSATTKVATETIKAVTVFLTESSTKVVAKTTTLKASTITETITSAATKTSTVSVPGATVTVTSLKTTTIKSTVTLPQSTVTSTKATVTTVKETVTLATPTTTVLKTTTVSLKPSVTITERATSTRTSTIDQTVTETSTVTKTSKSAKACPT